MNYKSGTRDQKKAAWREYKKWRECIDKADWAMEFSTLHREEELKLAAQKQWNKFTDIAEHGSDLYLYITHFVHRRYQQLLKAVQS